MKQNINCSIYFILFYDFADQYILHVAYLYDILAVCAINMRSTAIYSHDAYYSGVLVMVKELHCGYFVRVDRQN